MEPLSGNISDNKTLIRTIKEVRTNLITDETVYHMADSAVYSADSIASLGQLCFWITHVPETIKKTHNIVASKVVLSSCTDPRYSYAIFESTYGDVNQRWVLYNSVEQQKRSIQTQKKNLIKTWIKTRLLLKKLFVTGFAYEAEARKTVDKWMSTHPRYRVSNLMISVKNQRKFGQCGRTEKCENS